MRIGISIPKLVQKHFGRLRIFHIEELTDTQCASTRMSYQMTIARKLAMTLAISAALLPSSAAYADRMATNGYRLRLQVPLVCVVNHVQSVPILESSAVALGTLREFCNAPGGYDLLVDYAPGTMRGAILIVGQSRVPLDGSGHAIVNRSTVPHSRELGLAALPGENGFDTDRLDFRLVPHD